MRRPADILPTAARRFGDKTALITDDARLTFAELAEMSGRVAGALAQLGASPGDVVSIFSPNRWEWLVAYHGALRAGCVVNPVNGGWLGEGGSLSRAGVPTIGYIPQPNYLLAGPAGGCIEKLSPELMHSQIQVFAKLVHKIDAMSTAQLKGV